MGPMPTEVSPGKISMCVCMYCTLCWDFSEPIDWHLAVLHRCIHTYVYT